MENNNFTSVETIRAKNAAILPGLINRRVFRNDDKRKAVNRGKVETRQYVVLLPIEFGIEEYKERDVKIASFCRYDDLQELESGEYEIGFDCLSLCIVKDLRLDHSTYYADVEVLPEQPINMLDFEIRTLLDTIQRQFKEYLKLDPDVDLDAIEKVKNPESIDDLICGVVWGALLDLAAKRMLLNERDPIKRLQILSSGLETRIFEQEAEKGRDLVAFYKHKLSGLVIDAEVKKRIYLEMSRLKNLKTESSEYGNVIDWLDRILAFPWNVETEDNKDIKAASDILNNSHFGLDKLKQRIIDIVAIQKYTKKQPPQILCLYGPPGVGKSTVAKSIAEALDRDFYAVSLGGTNNPEEIAGMKRFFIGAKPGNIVDGVTQAGSKNCVLLLDEIDKIGRNQSKGDASAVLLGVLDRNQNNAFKDSYFDVPMDLSNVFFITTANDLSTIPTPLLNRLEVLTLDGYSLNEKVHITNNHLIKKVAAEFGLEQNVISLSPETIGKIIEQYTFESGVRQLENTIREIVRKHIAYKASSNAPLDSVELTIEDVNKMIEDAHEEEPNLASEDEIGVVNKMSVMNGNIGSVGRLEVVITESGKGEQIISDNIVGTALSTLKTVAGLLRYRADEWQVPREIFSDYDIYIHSPVEEKQHDGSSGGVADVICILSAIKNISIPHTIAFTGAVTLKGKILRIGGVKAKVLAAQRHRMKIIVLPLANKKDVDELPHDVVGDMEFKYFEDMVDVYDYIFNKYPQNDNIDTETQPQMNERNNKMNFTINKYKFELPGEWQQGDNAKIEADNIPGFSGYYTQQTPTYFLQLITQTIPAEHIDYIPAFDTKAVIQNAHEKLGDMAGIIEVSIIKTSTDQDLLRSITKESVNNLPVYTSKLYYRSPDGSGFVIQLVAREKGTTGTREAQIRVANQSTEMVKTTDSDGNIITQQAPIPNWSADPYDSSFTKGFLMNMSENAMYDQQFPSHPLSVLRADLESIQRTFNEG